MSVLKVYKRKIAGIIGKMLYYIHYLPLPSCKLPNSEEALKHLNETGYSFPPLWKDLAPLATTSCDLSIVIPVYNSEDFLAQCLSSIMNQKTQYNYEVICIDDGSTDGSSKILNRFKSEYSDRIIIHHQKNKGISKARNQGIIMAKGKYIGFMDNDDTVSQDYVEEIMKRAQETDADIIQTAFDLVDKDGISFKEKNKQEIVIGDSDSHNMHFHVSGYIWGGCMKKSLFSRVRFPEDYWYEDMIMRITLMRLSNVYATIPKILYHKTSHSNNASIKLWKRGTAKSIDQYWLPTQLISYQIKELEQPVNDGQYMSLLEEFSSSLWSRTRKLNTIIFKSLFVLASEVIIQLNYNPKVIDKESKATDRVLKKKKYFAWLLLSASRYYSGFVK